MFCDKCGTSLTSDQKFCPGCGTVTTAQPLTPQKQKDGPQVVPFEESVFARDAAKAKAAGTGAIVFVGVGRAI
jgi:uncharacterized membrane protein YvbJ